MNKHVGIIFPRYNKINKIQTTLQSIFSQTYCNYEVIIVDDDSTDATVDFIKTNFPKIKLTQQKKSRSLAARQTGISAAKGKFIALLDQDLECACHRTETGWPCRSCL